MKNDIAHEIKLLGKDTLSYQLQKYGIKHHFIICIVLCFNLIIHSTVKYVCQRITLLNKHIIYLGTVSYEEGESASD